MQPAPASAVSPAPATVAKPAPAQGSEITEAEVKQLLVGKQLFLLGGYLNDNLSFNEHGVLIGRSPAGSYTLNAIQIDRVKLTKHKVELEGSRYALRFLGALPYEEIGKSVDRVKITPNKRLIRITIDREMVVVPKKAKEGKSFFGKSGKSAPAAKPATAAAKPAAHAQAEAPPAVGQIRPQRKLAQLPRNRQPQQPQPRPHRRQRQLRQRLLLCPQQIPQRQSLQRWTSPVRLSS